MPVIQIRRGPSANLPSTAAPGEIMASTDTNQMFLGGADGTVVPLAIDAANIANPPVDSTLLATGTTTLTLPTSGIPVGKLYRIKNIGTGVITVVVANGGNIDGSSSITLTEQFAHVTCQWSGSRWWVV